MSTNATNRWQDSPGGRAYAENDCGVVVVGSGPVGMLLSSELRLAGVRTVVLEREAEPYPHARAWGLQPRTQDLLDRRGLLEGIEEEEPGQMPGATFAGRFLDYSSLDTEHPYYLHAPQSLVERVLEEGALALGAEIRRGHEVVGIAQGPDGVTAEVSGPGGAYRVRGRYLVGCDGGRSTVRKLAGVGFPGTAPTLGGLLADVVLPDPEDWRLGGTKSETGMLMVLGRKTFFRAVVLEWGRPHPDRRAPVTMEEFRAAVVRVLGRDLAMTEPRWLSRFGDAARRAESYRVGRVLLAGDAAHVHSPFGGQGLNLGLQDASNLGWKLAAEVGGWAPKGLLDTYHSERAPVADSVLENTRAQVALMDPGERLAPVRALFGGLADLPQVNDRLAEEISGVGVRYPMPNAGVGGEPHPLAGRFARDLGLKTDRGDSRLCALLRPGRGVLLVLAGRDDLRALGRGWLDRVDLVTTRSTGSAPAEALLIRPDGYVAWAAGEDPDRDRAGLCHALAAWFGSAAPVDPLKDTQGTDGA